MLISSLEAWDGKHIDHLIEVYNNHANDSEFFEQLIEITKQQQHLQVAATWLFKHHYDSKKTLSESQIDGILNLSPTFTDWGAQLHVLQLLPHIRISIKNFMLVEGFVRTCLNSNVKFVRAWAYEGFYQLTKLQPTYTEELKALCDKAMLTESASVKARIRKIITRL